MRRTPGGAPDRRRSRPQDSAALAQQKLLFEAAAKAGEAGEPVLSIQLYARLLARYPRQHARRAGARRGRSAEEEARQGLELRVQAAGVEDARPGRRPPSARGAGAAQHRLERREGSLRALSRGAKQRRMAAGAARGVAHRAGAAPRLQPAQRRRPIRSARRPAGRAAAPSTAAPGATAARRRRRTRARCSRTPRQKSGAVGTGSPPIFAAAARTAASAPDRRTLQLAVVPGGGARPAAAAPAQRFMQLERRACGALEAQRELARRPRQHLERRLGDQRRACRASRRAGATRRSRRRSSSPGRRS